MTGSHARVLVADGSATVRHVLRRMLEREGRVSIVGEAPDGATLRRLCREVAHDVLLMDLALPGFDPSATDGCPSPVVVVTSIRTASAARDSPFRAVAARVAGVYTKPDTAEGWGVLGQELAATVASLTRPRSKTTVVRGPRLEDLPDGGLQVVAIGASAGGPHALRDVLVGAGRRLRTRVAVVQHIAPGFEGGLADWLAAETGLDVRVASQTTAFEQGSVRIAPAGRHMTVTRDLELEFDDGAALAGHRPSIARLFGSLQPLPAPTVAAVLLSGMGDDGVDEMLDLGRRGAFTVVQDRSTCSVPGLSRAALARDASMLELSASEIGRVLSRMASREVRP